MPVDKEVLAMLTEKIDILEEARGLLMDIVLSDSTESLFSIRFLVISSDESYLVSPTSVKIKKIDDSLNTLGYTDDFLRDSRFRLNLFSNPQNYPNIYIENILKSGDMKYIIPFPHIIFSIPEYEEYKTDDCLIYLVFLTGSRERYDDTFFTFLVKEFHHFASFGSPWTYKDIYRIAEDAAYWVLDKTLPQKLTDSLDSQTYQRRYVVNDLLTRTISDISSLYYESSESQGCIQFIKDKKEFNGIELKKPIYFLSQNSRIIRKLLETAKSKSLIILDEQVIGLGTPVSSDRFTVHILGHLTWEYRINGICQFTYIHSSYKFPSSRVNKDNVISSIAKLFKLENEASENLYLTIEMAMDQRHGALLIITDNAKKESVRLCELNRGILIKPYSVIGSNSDIIKDITSIDGAIILDFKGVCHAIGVILDGKAVTHGSSSRGARYNSAKNYIKWKETSDSKHTYMAIVVSEDGMVNVFPADNEDEYKGFFSHFVPFRDDSK